MPVPPVSSDPAAVFSRAGLARGVWQRFRAEHTSVQTRANCLGSALEELGGIYAVFARFLCWRADLLPAEYLMALRRVRADFPPLPRGEFVRLVIGDVGLAGEALARGIETEPCWSTLQRCGYRSKYQGTPVVVQVAREPLSEKEFRRFERGVQLLDDPNTRRATSRAVLAQFLEWLRTGDDVSRERAFLVSIAESGLSEVEYPRLVPDGCGGRVLCWHWVEAEPVPELIAAGSATAVYQKIAQCVMEQICVLALTDAELDPDALAMAPDSKLVVRRANRFLPVPRSALPPCLKYVAAVLKEDAPAAAHLLVQLACSRPQPELETRLSERLSNLEPELKVNLRFPPSAQGFESNWRGLAALNVDRPLFLDSMHRNMVALGYWNSEVAATDGPPEDMIADAQWGIIGGLLRKRAWEMADSKTLYGWAMGTGIMMVEGLRQANRFAKGLRDNDLGVRIATDAGDEQGTQSNLAVRQGIAMGLLLIVFLVAMHWSTRLPPPYSTILTGAAFIAAIGALWILMRIG